MAKTSGLQARCYVAGYDISGDVSAISSIADSQNLQEVPGLDKEAMERLALLADGAVSINGWFNAAAGQEHAALLSSGKLPTADRAVLIPLSTSVGGPCLFMVAKQAKYDLTRAADGSLATAAEFNANGYGIEWGLMLTAGKRTDSSAADGASVNNGGASAAGASAVCQVFSLGSGTVTPVIQDSADDASFAAITGLSFSAVASAPAAERKATSATQAIRQYVRLSSTGTFTNAVIAVGFKRN